jgi:23S rRNA (uridine2552-2'-O)-methyltransferase
VNWLRFCSESARPKWTICGKSVSGRWFDEFRKQVVDSFDVLKTVKPAASRARLKKYF